MTKMGFTRCAWLVATWVQLAVHSARAEERAEEIAEKKKIKCGIYLAPSSIPGAGLGMYAGDKSYDKGDIVTFGDTVIPIIEFEWNNKHTDSDYSFLWDEYTWNSNVFPGMNEEGDDEDLIMVASPGVGAAANSYLSMVNVEDSYVKLGRAVKEGPGVGASSPYYGREFEATNPIIPGGEIFVDYGTNYFTTRPTTYGYLPMSRDYKWADRLIGKFQTKKYRFGNTPAIQEIWNDAWSLVKSFSSMWDTSRVLNALPQDPSMLAQIMQGGGSAKQDYNKSIKELSWLEENGQCMDNIKVGQSENPNAGRGAFANRFIPEGGLVAPAPLIHLPDSKVMKMYQAVTSSEEGQISPGIDGRSTFQLLMNYCFGHEKSTLLMCPYGLLTAFINHSHENPNTKIQWSKEMRHPEWRNQTISEWGDEYHTGVSLDFVALRDIEEDEEILIDYGEAWERAWQEHVRNFVPRTNYVPAFELNEMLDIEYRTVADGRSYEADGVQLMCREWYVARSLNDVKEERECRILKKLGEDRYMVQLIDYDYSDHDEKTYYPPGKILWDVPSDAFFFIDIHYMRDHHLFEAFRSPMMMPDDMFPEIWMNSPFGGTNLKTSEFSFKDQKKKEAKKEL